MTRRRAFLLVFVVALALFPLLPVSEFWISQACYIGLYSLVVIGLVLLTGVLGLISFGQSAFVGLGAYTAAYLVLTYGMSPWLTLLAGLAITAAVALVLGWITLRMSGPYLPVATIAWCLGLYYLLGNLDVLGKFDGLTGVPSLSLFGISLANRRHFFYLLWALVIVAVLMTNHLLDSRTGRALRAARNGTVMAEAMGVNTFRIKVMVFVLGALLASLSGWLFAYFQHTVNPSPFGLDMGIEYLFMAVLGGIGYVWGALLGAGVVVILQDRLQDWIPHLLGVTASYEIVVFGALMVLVLRYAQDGLWATIETHLAGVQRRRDWADAPALPQRTRPAHGELVLDANALRKEFGGLVAVNDVSLQVR
ncbi:MAG: metal-dependent hydrolase, partial [Rhodoferax sp.]